MVLLKTYLLFIFLSVVPDFLDGYTNMAANSVGYTSDLVSGDPTMLTDQNLATTKCLVTTNDVSYAVVDLGLEVNVSSVEVWSTSTKVSNLNGFQVVVMDDWRSCHSSNIFSNKVCGSLTISESANFAVANVTECTGRFIAVANPNMVQQSITICEMKVYGSKVNSGSTALRQPPYQRQCGVNDNPYLSLDLALNKYCNSSMIQDLESNSGLVFATDGIEVFNEMCFQTYQTATYLVVDLGQQVNISFVRIQSTWWDNPTLENYEAAFTDSWQECSPNIIPQFPLCPGTIVPNSPEDLWELQTSGSCIGRFFILRPKDPTALLWLKVCEIEVYGTPTNVNAVVQYTFDNLCKLLPTDQNIAFGALTLANYNVNGVSITNGVLDQQDVYNTCFYTYWAEYNYVVVDLGAFYQLQGIKIWNSMNGDGNQFTIDVGVGQVYRQQYSDEDILNFQIIGPGLATDSAFTIIKMSPDQNIVAQFILIQKEMNYLNSLIVCQLEVQGTQVPNMPPYNPRPQISSVDLAPSSINDFPINSVLRSGVSFLYFLQYSAPILSVGLTTEGILWIPSSSLPIAVAGFYGSGRWAAFGKGEYFSSSIATDFDPVFHQNLYQWLSPTKGLNAAVISQDKVSTASVGSIVHFDITISLSSSQQTSLLTALHAGTVSLVIEVTYWAEIYYESHRSNYDFLLRALEIDFSGNYLGDSDQQIPISNQDFVNNDFRNLIQQMSAMSQNEQYVYDTGLNFVHNIDSLSDYLGNSDMSSVMETLVTKYQALVKYVSPGIMTPMRKGDDEILILVYNALIKSQTLAGLGLKAPTVDIFPGDVAPGTPTISVTLNISAQQPNDIHATGLYLPAGASLSYNSPSISGQWLISIGCHTDQLFFQPDDPSYHWIRFPDVVSGFQTVSVTSGTLYSPFGGVVWIQNVDVPGNLVIHISGVVQSPFFNVRDPNADAVWDATVSSPGLWTEIVGQYLIICAPSSLLNTFTSDQIRTCVQTWDMAVGLTNILAGTQAQDNRRERITIDTQIAYGYGHSGYPIMTVYSWFPNLFDENVINAPNSWGVVHEMGHRRQRDEYIFTGTLEVTVNIFPDFMWNYMWNVTLFSGYHEKYTDSVQQDIVNYFANGPDFNVWLQDSSLAYMIYGQIGYHFGFGLYQNVFINYTTGNPTPQSDQDKIDLWINTVSDYANYNLVPLFDFWAFPISDNVRTYNSAKTCFLPLDPISELVLAWYYHISANYNNECVTEPAQKIEFVVPDIVVHNLPNDIVYVK